MNDTENDGNDTIKNNRENDNMNDAENDSENESENYSENDDQNTNENDSVNDSDNDNENTSQNNRKNDIENKFRMTVSMPLLSFISLGCQNDFLKSLQATEQCHTSTPDVLKSIEELNPSQSVAEKCHISCRSDDIEGSKYQETREIVK